MTSSAKPIEQVQNLIKKGELVLSTRTANQPNLSRNLHVDTKASNEWDAQALNFLISLLGSDHIYTKRFDTI